MRKVLELWGILNDSDIEWMVTAGQRQDVAAGSVLIEEGKPADAMFILLDGGFGVSVAEQELGRLLSGEVVGEISFVDSRLPSATVKAIDNGIVLAIPKYALTTRLQQDNAFAARFYRALAMSLADRLRERTSRHEYHQDDALQDDLEYDDELNPEVLESVALAGARFDWMRRRLHVQRG